MKPILLIIIAIQSVLLLSSQVSFGNTIESKPIDPIEKPIAPIKPIECPTCPRCLFTMPTRTTTTVKRTTTTQINLLKLRQLINR